MCVCVCVCACMCVCISPCSSGETLLSSPLPLSLSPTFCLSFVSLFLPCWSSQAHSILILSSHFFSDDIYANRLSGTHCEDSRNPTRSSAVIEFQATIESVQSLPLRPHGSQGANGWRREDVGIMDAHRHVKEAVEG